MSKSSKIEAADLTPYQEHMEKAAKVGLRRLRRHDALFISEALANAFSTTTDDERRRLIMSTRLCLLNEQLQKMGSLNVPAVPKAPKVKKPAPVPEPEPEPAPPPPPPPPPKKDPTLNMMDLTNAAMLLMSADEPEEDEEDPMAFLTASDDDAKETAEEEDHMAFLTASDDDAKETAEEEDHMAFLTASDDGEKPTPDGE